MDWNTFTLGAFVGFLIGTVVCVLLVTDAWRYGTITRGLAIYCPQDGNFAFIGECKE